MTCSVQFSSAQSLSHVRLFATPWIATRQASLSITNSRSTLRLMSIESVMPSSHLILCRPLLLLPPIPPSIRFFSNESTLHMRWPIYWSFSFSIIPSKEIPGLISFRMDWRFPWPVHIIKINIQFSSVTQLYLTLCDPMDCSRPGFPAHHQLPELTQTHVHWVGDVIQPSHSLSPPSLPTFNLSQHQGLFK